MSATAADKPVPGWMAQPVTDPGPPPAKPDPVQAVRRALTEAEQLEQAGDLRRAFVTCQSVLIDHSGNIPAELLARLQLTLGRISIAQDKPERARRYFEQAATINPDLAGLADLRKQVREPQPGASLGTAPAPRPAPKPVPKPELKPAPRPVPKPASRPVPKPAPQPVPDPEPVAGAVPVPVSDPAPAPEPELDSDRGVAVATTGRLAFVASFWARAAALVLDLGLIAGLLASMVALAAVVLGLSGEVMAETLAGGFGNLVVFGALFVALLLIYQTIFARFGGQTLGKMLLGLRVVRQDGHSLTSPQAALRALGILLAGLPGLGGFLWAAFDLNRRGWHDRVGGTLVVRLRPPRAAHVSVAAAPPGLSGN